MNNYRFEVEKKQIYLANGQEVTDSRAIVRTDTGHVLGTVGKGYSPIQHYKIIDAFEGTGILRLKNVNLCKDGAVMFANFDLRDNGGIRKEEVKVGDLVSFGVRAFNAHNGDYGVGFEVNANRLACLNGMVIPKAIARINLKHRFGTTIETIREAIMEKQREIAPAIGTWKRWMTIHPSKARIENFFTEAGIGERISKELLPRSVDASEKDGVWGIWNEFTHYVTHELKVKNESNRIISVVDKEQTYLHRFYNFNWEAEAKVLVNN